MVPKAWQPIAALFLILVLCQVGLIHASQCDKQENSEAPLGESSVARRTARFFGWSQLPIELRIHILLQASLRTKSAASRVDRSLRHLIKYLAPLRPSPDAPSVLSFEALADLPLSSLSHIRGLGDLVKAIRAGSLHTFLLWPPPPGAARLHRRRPSWQRTLTQGTKLAYMQNTLVMCLLKATHSIDEPRPIRLRIPIPFKAEDQKACFRHVLDTLVVWRPLLRQYPAARIEVILYGADWVGEAPLTAISDLHAYLSAARGKHAALMRAVMGLKLAGQPVQFFPTPNLTGPLSRAEVVLLTPLEWVRTKEVPRLERLSAVWWSALRDLQQGRSIVKVHAEHVATLDSIPGPWAALAF